MSTTLRLKIETKKRVIQTRGKMEFKDGKRRSEDDVINELIDYFEGEKTKLQEFRQEFKSSMERMQFPLGTIDLFLRLFDEKFKELI